MRFLTLPAALAALLCSAAVAALAHFVPAAANTLALFGLILAACLASAWAGGRGYAGLRLAAALANQRQGKPRRDSRPAKPRDKNNSRQPARRQDNSAASGPRETGTVKWFNRSKGFGFIVRPDGAEIFVHYRSIRGGGRQALEDGETVNYQLATGKRGDQAEDVVRGASDHGGGQA